MTQDARTLDSIRARGSESLQTRGAYTEAAAVRLIERFVSEAIENPTGNPTLCHCTEFKNRT